MDVCYFGDSCLVFFPTESEGKLWEKWPKWQPRCCHTCVFIAHHTDGHSSDGRSMSRGRPPHTGKNTIKTIIAIGNSFWAQGFVEWWCLFVCLFCNLSTRHSYNLTCRHRSHLEDWGENISLTKLTNRQTKKYRLQKQLGHGVDPVQYTKMVSAQTGGRVHRWAVDGDHREMQTLNISDNK